MMAHLPDSYTKLFHTGEILESGEIAGESPQNLSIPYIKYAKPFSIQLAAITL